RILENNFTTICEEARAIPDDADIDYTQAVAPRRSWKRPWTLLQARPKPRSWTVYPFYHQGVAIDSVAARCPRTFQTLRSVPRACLDYPWGDFIFSATNPGAHLPPHCSIDNLRVRIHLALTAPKGCAIRVGDEIRSWQVGECLAFEDSFEHEVWNRSGARRV